MRPRTATTRITGGAWRGRRLSTPGDRLLRPTRAVVREALFNILGDRVVGARLVDLFCGAGTVGFEALSRGAEHVTFVDREPRSLDHVRASARLLGCERACTIVQADAALWVGGAAAVAAAADAVYVDAPYRDDGVDAVLVALAQNPPALVVCEHHRARELPVLSGLLPVRRSHYGVSDLSFLQPPDSSHDPARSDP
ncbi:MAG: 16S rRNA (guanine(966)-N(2))-methyltransferase RsmD [Candidatus Dormibacteria bacterium]